MKITESQLRKIIRQEVGRLVEMPARRAPQGGVYTDPDTMPRGPKVSRSQKIADAPDTFAYQQLMQHAPDKLEQLETEAPEAYEDFLVTLYDMSDPDSGKGGLDGSGFMPELDRALATAGLSGMGDFDPEVFAAEINQRMPVESFRRRDSRRLEKAGQIVQDMYRRVVKPYDEYISENDVQGTSRMMVGDIASPGEKRLLQIISLLHRYQQYPLIVAMSKMSRARSSVKDLEDLSNRLFLRGDY